MPEPRQGATTPGSLDRLQALDGLRGLAILAIIVLHYLVYPVIRTGEGRLPGLAAAVGGHLWNGVDLFFVLSGFLIAGSLLHAREQPRYFARFAVRRVLRIGPLYLVLLLVLLALVSAGAGSGPLVKDRYPWIAYLTLTQNYWLGGTGEYGGDLMAATWSLAIEVQFYVLVAALVRWLPGRALMLACAALIAISVAFRLSLPYPASYAYTFCRADALFAGVAAAVAWNGAGQGRLASGLQQHRRPVMLASLAAYAATAWLAPKAGSAWNHLVFAAVFTTWLGLALTADSTRSTLTAPWLRWFGRASYGLYLFHYGMLSAVFFVATGGEPVLHSAADWALMGATFALCLGLVAVLHRSLELPMIDRGRRMAMALARKDPLRDDAAPSLTRAAPRP